MADWADYEPVVASWRRRYELCRGTREPKSPGWTFGQFLLASVRMGDGSAAQRDLGLVQPARLADAEWIQFFETSDRNGWTSRMAYYFTTMGLYVMAMLEAVVQDWRGRIDVLPALLPRWGDGPIAFERLHLRGGLVASGRYEEGRLEMELSASADVETKLAVRVAGSYRMESPAGSEDFAADQEVPLKLAAGQTARIVSQG